MPQAKPEKTSGLLTASRVQNPLPATVTRLLNRWKDGDSNALNQCFADVYQELKYAAKQKIWDQSKLVTMGATELVGEVYLRLRDRPKLNFQSRAHFFWFASVLMRDILVEEFRRKLTAKRGAGMVAIDLEAAEVVSGRESLDIQTILTLDHALSRLEILDSRQASIVIMRFFAGMNYGEIAQVLQISLTTVKRDWQHAKRWLTLEMKGIEAQIG